MYENRYILLFNINNQYSNSTIIVTVLQFKTTVIQNSRNKKQNCLNEALNLDKIRHNRRSD